MSKPTTKLTIQYSEVKMDRLIEYWCANFDTPKPTLGEWFYDPGKGTVILKLYVSEVTP